MLFVLSGPSGTGKTTLCRMLTQACPKEFWFSVSHTTRPRRHMEEDGKDYHFVSEEAFQDMIAKGAFLEWAKVYDAYYGTALVPVEEALERGYNILLDIDVQGGLAVKKRRDDVALIFIVPPSLAALEARLKGRGRDEPDVLRKRLQAAMGEIERAFAEYEYIVVNDDLGNALQDVLAITKSAPFKLNKRKQAVLEGFRQEWDQKQSRLK
jgi:guanylate kinase